MKNRKHHAVQSDERAVAQRFEAKYIIGELEALAIRDFIEPYVVTDSHGREYDVTSVYLDSPNLAMYQSSNLGEKNRHKLRIRTYGSGTGVPVFFEVKRRMDQVIRKYRAVVREELVTYVLRGGRITADVMADPSDTAGLQNLLHFRDLMDSLSASPRVVVKYAREAYVSNLEEPVRVTFDRRLACISTMTYNPSVWAAGGGLWRALDGYPVILEIKFTDTYPLWIGQVIRRMHLIRDSVAKYVACVSAMQDEGLVVAG